MTGKMAFILSMLLVCASLSFAQPKTTLAIMDLNCTGISESDGNILTNALLSEIVNTNSFDVVERSKRDEILREQGFAQSGACDDASCLIEVGKYLSVQKMVGGNIGKLGQTWTVNIRLLDVKTGKIDKASTRYYKGEIDILLAYMREIAGEIAHVGTLSKGQLAAIKQRQVADSLASVEARRAAARDEEDKKAIIAAHQQAEDDSIAAAQARADKIAEDERKTQLENERLAKEKALAEERARIKEANRTKLKLPVLTYSSLACGVVATGLTYYFYSGTSRAYDNYNNATNPDDAAKYRKESDSKNKNAGICSYVSGGLLAAAVASWFIREKVHKEQQQSGLMPEIDLTLNPFPKALDLTPNPSPNAFGEGQGRGRVTLTWRCQP